MPDQIIIRPPDGILVDSYLMESAPSAPNGTDEFLFAAREDERTARNMVLDFEYPEGYRRFKRITLALWIHELAFETPGSEWSINPLLERFAENHASYNERSPGNAWTMPGGTFEPDLAIKFSATVIPKVPGWFKVDIQDVVNPYISPDGPRIAGIIIRYTGKAGLTGILGAHSVQNSNPETIPFLEYDIRSAE